MEPRPVAHSLSVLVHWLGPTDLNSAGFVHGGVVMKLIEIGELLTLRASVNAVWRTSMEVGVRVEAERPAVGTVRHTNSAYLTMVAVDDQGRPRPVAPLVVAGAVEERRERAAQMRRRNRLTEREEIVGG